MLGYVLLSITTILTAYLAYTVQKQSHANIFLYFILMSLAYGIASKWHKANVKQPHESPSWLQCMLVSFAANLLLFVATLYQDVRFIPGLVAGFILGSVTSGYLASSNQISKEQEPAWLKRQLKNLSHRIVRTNAIKFVLAPFVAFVISMFVSNYSPKYVVAILVAYFAGRKAGDVAEQAKLEDDCKLYTKKLFGVYFISPRVTAFVGPLFLAVWGICVSIGWNIFPKIKIDLLAIVGFILGFLAL